MELLTSLFESRYFDFVKCGANGIARRVIIFAVPNVSSCRTDSNKLMCKPTFAALGIKSCATKHQCIKAIQFKTTFTIVCASDRARFEFRLLFSIHSSDITPSFRLSIEHEHGMEHSRRDFRQIFAVDVIGLAFVRFPNEILELKRKQMIM